MTTEANPRRRVPGLPHRGTAVYQNLAKNAATVLHRLTARGGSVTSAVLRETHVTGLQASFLSYLRTCRAR
ncbi:hypothetical protein ACWEGE_34645 [Amycolatopsis sp. NPDC004747]